MFFLWIAQHLATPVGSIFNVRVSVTKTLIIVLYLFGFFWLGGASSPTVPISKSKAMSGPYRQMIGPTKHRLQSLLLSNQETTIRSYDSQKSKHENLQMLNKTKHDLNNWIGKLESSVSILEKQHSDWTAFLQQLEGAEFKTEEALYMKTSEGTPDNIGYVSIMLEGKEKIVELRVRLTEIDQTIDNVETNVSSVSHISATHPLSADQSVSDGTRSHHPAENGPHPALPQPQPSQAPHPAPVSGACIKLPKIELPIFYGDPTKFKPFWDLFTSAIQNQNLSNVEKFIYLTGMLRGKSQQALEGIDRMEENYTQAVEILHSKFGLDRVVKQTLLNRLEQVPKANNSVKELRNTVDNTEKILRQLEAIGENIEQSSLVRTVLKKFPNDILMKLEERKDTQNEWNIDELRRHMNDIISLKERVLNITGYNTNTENIGERPTNQRGQWNQNTNNQKSYRGSHPGSSVFPVNSDNSSSVRKKDSNSSSAIPGGFPMSKCAF